MKKFLALILLTTTTLFCFAQEKNIVIIHTNDMHSQVEPFAENAGGYKAGKGGMVRVATFIEQEREANKNILVLDAGDFSQGTPYYNLFSGEAEIAMMNAAGYDAATLGNHEFDLGMDNLALLIRQADFPFVNANFDFTGTPLEGLVKPYVILYKDNVKIGVFGLSVDLKGYTFENNYAGIVFKNTFESAAEMEDLLKNKEHCDLIICLSHIGYDGDPDDVSDYNVAAKSHYIDVIIGGHTHTYLQKPQEVKNADGKIVYVAQTGSSCMHVGEIVVTLDED